MTVENPNNQQPPPNELPRHIGVVMDGNRRWAKRHGVAVGEGHRSGYRRLMSLLPMVRDLGIPFVSVYAFSTENWSRSRDEVGGLMKLVLWVARYELKKFIASGVRLRVVGSWENIPADVTAALRKMEAATADCTRLTLGLCFNYGGRQELADACRRLVEQGIAAQDITPEKISEHVYAPELPPLDLIIRTSGEQRLSGFMLWRSEYAELYFTDVLWPDFDERQLQLALQAYAGRGRRFGA